jgi:outer membrane protein assembly factor BamB
MSSGRVVAGGKPGHCSWRRTYRDTRSLATVAAAAVFFLSGASSHSSLARTGTASGPPKIVWRVPVSGRGTPVSDGPAVYFVTETHELVSVSSRTGIVNWRTRIGEETAATSGSRLLVRGPLIVVGDYDVVACERRTGAIRWRFHPVDGYGPGIYLGNAEKGVITAGSPAGRLYALDGNTGQVRWSTTVIDDGKTTVFPPSIKDKLVVASYTTFAAPATGGVVALRLASGEEIWRRPFPAAPAGRLGSTAAAGGPIVVDGVVIAADGLGRIHGFDVATGTIRWSIPWAPGDDAWAAAEPVEFRALAAWGHTLFAASLHGILTAYDLRTLTQRWRYYDGANGSAGFQISVADGRLFVPFVSAGLVQLRASDGQELWRTNTAFTGMVWPPEVSGRRIYVASGSGLLALEETR